MIDGIDHIFMSIAERATAEEVCVCEKRGARGSPNLGGAKDCTGAERERGYGADMEEERRVSI